MIRLATTSRVADILEIEHQFWHGALLDMDLLELETQWKNPELEGVWVLHYPVTQMCAERLLSTGLMFLEIQYTPYRRLYRLGSTDRAQLTARLKTQKPG